MSSCSRERDRVPLEEGAVQNAQCGHAPLARMHYAKYGMQNGGHFAFRMRNGASCKMQNDPRGDGSYCRAPALQNAKCKMRVILASECKDAKCKIPLTSHSAEPDFLAKWVAKSVAKWVMRNDPHFVFRRYPYCQECKLRNEDHVAFRMRTVRQSIA